MAAVELARLPVLAQLTVEKPSSLARVGHAHHPVFEEGGHVRIVLDVELLEARAASRAVGAQRGEASADINRLALDGQEIAITPIEAGPASMEARLTRARMAS